MEAIEGCHDALALVNSVVTELVQGASRRSKVSQRLAAAWFLVNRSRGWTQANQKLEELDVENMGLIDDGRTKFATS